MNADTFKAECECGAVLVSQAAEPMAHPGAARVAFGPCPRCGLVFTAEWRGGRA